MINVGIYFCYTRSDFWPCGQANDKARHNDDDCIWCQKRSTGGDNKNEKGGGGPFQGGIELLNEWS